MKFTKKHHAGMSLIEILVAISIFAILGVVISKSILLTLRGVRKSESTLKAKENINYAMAIVERALRNADEVTCPNLSPTVLDYTDEKGEATTFSCIGLGTEDSYIASGSARLTNTDITIKSCEISCSPSDNATPTVAIDISAGDKNATGIENSTFTSSTQILLRSY
ncbi:MAG: type II secretion system protein [bacterium]|nr:type II secretion system protein [bacterium]